MKTRTLGRTGYQVSSMGFGCGGFWGYPVFDESRAIGLIHQAIDLGVTFFDTGASYSGGNAEVRLGKALKGRDTSALLVGTKAGTVIRNGKLAKDFSRASIFEQVENSLRVLHLDCLPLLQLHAPRIQDLNDDVFETLQLLKKQGMVRLVGASCDGKELEKALSFNQLDVVMLTFNLIEKHAIRHVRIAGEQGCGVLVKSPLCHTLYSNEIFKFRKLSDVWYFLRVLKNYRPQLFEGFKYRFVNNIDGWKGHDIALLYALADGVSCVVTGTTRPENMLSNAQALSRTLSKELRDRIDAVD